jgi:glutaredoxin
VSLVLYGRPGCHLCDDARQVLERLGHPFEEVDIESDEALLRRWLERIPVIVRDGEILSELVVNEARLQARLGKVGRR